MKCMSKKIKMHRQKNIDLYNKNMKYQELIRMQNNFIGHNNSIIVTLKKYILRSSGTGQIISPLYRCDSCQERTQYDIYQKPPGKYDKIKKLINDLKLTT